MLSFDNVDGHQKPWLTDAACGDPAHSPVSMFFVDSHECTDNCLDEETCEGDGTDEAATTRRARIFEAKKFCNTQCPVVAECLEWALETPEQLGVVGGTSAWARIQMRADRARELRVEIKNNRKEQDS